jgi:hypothetical protein
MLVETKTLTQVVLSGDGTKGLIVSVDGETVSIAIGTVATTVDKAVLKELITQLNELLK